MKNNDAIYNWSGERLETFIVNDTMLEHLHRYALAMNIAKGKKVLDIACGEGYGTHLLSKNALEVTGVDIETIVIEKAAKKYSNANIRFKVGSATNIPLPENSVDVVVSFETLEHLADHYLMMSEIKRVLTPSGILIISTPDKLNYADKNELKNVFHIKELYKEEFRLLIKHFFKNTIFLEQRSSFSSIILGEKPEMLTHLQGDYDQITTGEFEPYYHIAVASDNNELPLLNYSGIFRGLPPYNEIVHRSEQNVRKTITYKVGNIILFPFKIIRSVLKKISPVQK